ncbi:MAG TPA: hypothetical protein VGN17_03515 [Bryobacteraceae bacterium]|jgi:hypothetical protein
MLSLSSLSAGKIIPSRITQVLQQMQSIYGNQLEITRLTASEVNLKVRSMPDTLLIANMMTRTSEIFGASGPVTGQACVLGPMDFEILCEQGGPAGQGLFLTYLPNTTNRQSRLSGYWFY